MPSHTGTHTNTHTEIKVKVTATVCHLRSRPHKLYDPVEEIRRWRLLCIARTEALSFYGHAVRQGQHESTEENERRRRETLELDNGPVIVVDA